MSRFGACSARISGDTHTDTQNDYRNPRCACAPRVNNKSLVNINSYLMKSTEVQNPRRILHILRSMPMRVHRACAGFGQKLYACALFIIDGLGHATCPRRCRFLDPERRLFNEIATLFFERLLR